MNTTMCVLYFFIPALTAFLNRWGRGDGGMPRWLWYSVMSFLAGFIGGGSLGIMFLLVLAGYAMAPWQAMFSAGTGRQPSRADSWAWDWMRRLALKWCDMRDPQQLPLVYSSQQWMRFGVIYGIIRGALTLPGIIMICGYTGSWAPLVGILFCGMGYVYYLAGKVQRAEGWPEPTFVTIAEIVMGWWLGTYMIICAVV